MNWLISATPQTNIKIQQVDSIWNQPCFSLSSNRSVIVIDRVVHDLYHQYLPANARVHLIDCGEANKNLHTAQTVWNFFNEIDLKRREPVLAIGGGVALDLVGFCCSIYRRGVPYVRIPTTLLAIVDAAVGIKTGVNYLNYRNRLGSYHAPALTLIDNKFISTQDQRHISNGLAEIIKLAIIADSELFELLEQDSGLLLTEKFQHNDLANKIIERSISTMVAQLSSNLWETDLKRAVDFGHSFSPMIEMQNINELLHGEAVVLDCLFCCCIAYHRNYIGMDVLNRIISVIKKFNLPLYHRDFSNLSTIKKSLSETLAHRDNNQNLPLPLGIGQYCIVNDISDLDLTDAVSTMIKINDFVDIVK
jgi:3-dehydroquinate synthetase